MNKFASRYLLISAEIATNNIEEITLSFIQSKFPKITDVKTEKKEFGGRSSQLQLGILFYF